MTPLQYSIVKGNLRTSYMKVISLLNTKEGTQRVIGMHYVGPSADEVIAGFALAMKLGLTKEDLDASFGIHPSTSEDFFSLDVTKRSGKDYAKTEC